MATSGTLEQAVYQFVDNGSYPEEVQTVSAELSSATLQNLGKLLEQARADVKASICELSRLSAPDVDGWIQQAKQLKNDINESVEQAEELAKLGDENARLRETTSDALAKIGLLKSEVAFSEGLLKPIISLKELREVVHNLSTAVSNDAYVQAVDSIDNIQAKIAKIGSFQSSTAVTLVQETLTELRTTLIGKLHKSWEDLVQVDASRRSITVQTRSSRVNLSDVSVALQRLGLLEPVVDNLWQNFDAAILRPRLASSGGRSLTVSVSGATMSLSGWHDDATIQNLLLDVNTIRDYLQLQLPASLNTELCKFMMPSLMSRLVKGPLPASVPHDLDGIPGFSASLLQVTSFVNNLQATGWSDTSELESWVKDAPNVWLRGKFSSALNSIRQLLKRGLGNPRSVERVETQIVSARDDVFGADDSTEDWDAGWDDDDDTDASKKAPTPVSSGPAGDDDDSDAWGWDEEGGAVAKTEVADIASEAEEDGAGEAWGWGDDEEKEQPISTITEQEAESAQTSNSTTNGRQNPAASAQKTVTLREAYFITAIPEQILELVIMTVEDADNLAISPDNPVSSATDGLYGLPSILIAMYRAMSPNTYSVHESGSMFVYNDSQYLAEQLRGFADHHSSRNPTNHTLNLGSAVSVLETFGKRSYSKEMDSQRTILIDLLDGAQGFSGCTDAEFEDQCDVAVSSVIDRIRQVHTQWKGVLSPSAVLQASGSLLSTVINKIILDIEDMDDISEKQSEKLTSYCNNISTLENLFIREASEDSASSEQPVALTAVYAPSWLKFQYLSNILESSLVDLKYLWTESNLSLEFTGDEVVNLIEALFAPSQRRKEVIGEIRKSVR